jgi:succinoglycan biosynthesis protein ExoA
MTDTHVEPVQDTSRRRPSVSVVIPMRNEADFVEQLAEDLAAQDIDEPFEVLVADGGSTDGSRQLLSRAADRVGLDLELLQNPQGHASAGLNVCVRKASGDLIVRLDCHTRYPPDYLRRCVDGLRETGAWNVSGVFTPIGRTRMERAVACALDSPFGGHNWTRKLGFGRRVEVDTNYLGAFPTEAIKRVGLYDEDLVVVEVEDLNLRLRKAGGRVLLDPEIRSFYYPRGSFREVYRQYHRYGYWKLAAMAKHHQVVSGRSVIPCGFVLSVAGLGGAALMSRAARRLLAAELAAYAIGAVTFGAAAIRKRRESPILFPRVLFVFSTFHVAHGGGMIHAAIERLFGRGPIVGRSSLARSGSPSSLARTRWSRGAAGRSSSPAG